MSSHRSGLGGAPLASLLHLAVTVLGAQNSDGTEPPVSSGLKTTGQVHTFLKNPPPELTWAIFAQPLGQATAALLMPPLELTRASPFARTLKLAVVETARLKLLPR